MPKVGIHPPKTPVTAGSSGVAKASVPNVCKMPGPPAPFVPSPMPNIAKSGKSPKGYSKSVKIEGEDVAIRGASFESMGDMASKATGGGMLSANAHGPAKFASPGSLTVKAEGKNIHLKGEPMLNNVGASGSPPNTGSTTPGEDQGSAKALEVLKAIHKKCNETVPPEEKGKKKSCRKLGNDKHECCEKAVQEHRSKNPKNGDPPIEGENGYKRPPLDENNEPIKVDGKFPPLNPPGGLGPRPDLGAAFKAGGAAIGAAFKAMKGNCYPDAAILGSGTPPSKTFVDFKFPCPPGHPAGRGTSKGGVQTSMSPKQQGSYDSLGLGSGGGRAITI